MKKFMMKILRRMDGLEDTVTYIVNGVTIE